MFFPSRKLVFAGESHQRSCVLLAIWKWKWEKVILYCMVSIYLDQHFVWFGRRKSHTHTHNTQKYNMVGLGQQNVHLHRQRHTHTHTLWLLESPLNTFSSNQNSYSNFLSFCRSSCVASLFHYRSKRFVALVCEWREVSFVWSAWSILWANRVDCASVTTMTIFRMPDKEKPIKHTALTAYTYTWMYCCYCGRLCCRSSIVVIFVATFWVCSSCNKISDDCVDEATFYYLSLSTSFLLAFNIISVLCWFFLHTLVRNVCIK